MESSGNTSPDGCYVCIFQEEERRWQHSFRRSLWSCRSSCCRACGSQGDGGVREAREPRTRPSGISGIRNDRRRHTDHLAGATTW